MIAAFAVLTIMPLDLVFSEVLQNSLADAREEILFGILQWQAEGTIFGFVESRMPGFRGEGGRELLGG